MFLDFLRDNWKILAEVILLVISLLIIVFRKKTKINIPESTVIDLYSLLPDWINQAEKEIGAGSGDLKLQYVLKCATLFICNQLGISVSDIPQKLILSVTSQIEDVLSTPHKKGE